MTTKVAVESVGLRGAKTMGDKKVSSLLQFSWSSRRDSSVNGNRNTGAERNGAHAESSVSHRGHKKED
jgi:hypothetical protein